MEVIIRYHVRILLETNRFFFYSYKINFLINFIGKKAKLYSAFPTFLA